MKKILVCSAMALFMVASSAVLTFADKGPADIIVGADGKKPAVFPHAVHQDMMGCAECHHSMADDGSQVPYVEGQAIQKCAECHTGDTLAGKTAGKLKLDTMKGAGHGNCLECHKEKAAADEAMKDLKKCSTCHPKK